MLLQTTWFGSFVLDEGKVVQQRLFPKEAHALADRLAKVEDWKVLDEERELLGAVGEVFVMEPRLERAGGHFTSEKTTFLKSEDFGFDRGLLHDAMVELAKRRMRKAIRREDHLRQAVAAVDDLLEQENTILERVREWYGLHFPELARMVDETTYLELVATHGRREKLPIEHRDSVGAELGDPEEREIRGLAQLAQNLAGERAALEAYVDQSIHELAPNVTDLAGPMIAARLVTLAGGVENLARQPAGTVQLLGAERALFRHLKTGARPPKHGVLFQHPLVHRAPPWQRGAIARALAGKIAMAARADAYTHRRISAELQASLEKTIAEIRRRKEEKPQRPKARHQAHPKRSHARKRL
ncbi:MAG: ribosomal biogenesis protein [Thermoplasmata archaeon]